MEFENSPYYRDMKFFKLEKHFGNFYLGETYFVSELNEGVHFDWNMIQEVMDDLVDFYDEGVKLGYISNRINSYSINPYTWKNVLSEYGVIIASAVVIYNHLGYLNTTLEKHFSSKSIKRCLSLEEAVEWVSGLRELK